MQDNSGRQITMKLEFHHINVVAGVLKVLEARGIPYSDYGTAFSKDWHQVFFQDPEGNVIEVHQEVATMSVE